MDWDSLAGENTSPEEELEEAYSLQVRRVIRSYYIQRARSCFDHASRTTQESVRGTVVIGFTITQSGQIANTEVVRNSTGSDSLAACLSQQVAAWRLPPPPRSMGEVPMQMPFGS